LIGHKQNCVSQAIVKAEEKREEKLADNLHDQLTRVLDRAWALTDNAEQEGDSRGAVVLYGRCGSASRS